MQGPEEKDTAVRKAPATRTKPSVALLIEGFKRPFTDKAAAALFSEHGEAGIHCLLGSIQEPKLATFQCHHDSHTCCMPHAYQ